MKKQILQFLKVTSFSKLLKASLLIGTVLSASQVFSQYQMEKLDRGVTAVSMSATKVFISWRWLGTEPDNIGFNIYRNNVKLNATPLTVCNYTDNAGSSSATYTVTSVLNNVELAPSAPVKPWAQQYMKVPIQAPAGGTTPDGVAYTYNANDASIGDLDGDGQWEIILKWDPTNAKDNSQSGYTGNTYVDAYKLDGTRLWRIDYGKNIRSGAHYMDFMVYDFDGDGKAEMMSRTGDGTIDGKGNAIGNKNADYRTSAGYILSGPEYISVFNGETGAVMATSDYYPARGSVGDWGDTYGNRVDRFKAAVAYVDGKRPTGIFVRGYYAKWGCAAWDWRGGVLTRRWTYMCPNDKTNPCYEEGAHSVSVADVDGDGKQEIITGSAILDDNGTLYYNTAKGHGDALHVSDMDPDLPGLEISHIQEPVGDAGLYMYSGKDKKILWKIPSGAGVTEGPGRGVCADISADYRGAESWAQGGGVPGVYDCKGKLTTLGNPQSCNFLTWWDGDLLRELLNNTMIDKFGVGRIYTAYQVAPIASNNGSKSTPSLSGDIFGDWREEVIWRASANDALYIFTTTTPSTYKFRTFLHDAQYRVALAWQNTGYNQPPHVSYYLGEGMSTPPAPNIEIIGATNQAPIININAIPSVDPVSGLAYVDLSAVATDPDGSVAKVQYLYRKGGTTNIVEITSITSNSYNFKWNNVEAGTYFVYAKATDNKGVVSNSNIIQISVEGTNSFPTISITSPVNNQVYSGTPANITLNVKAQDIDGSVAKVEFYEGTTLIGESTVAPFTFNWANVEAGTYKLTAVAIDNKGSKSTSDLVVVSVTELPKDCNGVQGGNASIDNCDRCVGGNTGKTACSVVLEMEKIACSFDGVLESTNEGFSGDSYINVPNVLNSKISFPIYSTTGGNSLIGIRYANNSATNRKALLTINGISQVNLVDFVNTGSWMDWQMVETQVNLMPGNNIIELIANTTEGLANIDQLGLISSGLSEGSCVVTSITSVDETFGAEVFPNPSSLNFTLTTSEVSDIVIYNSLGTEIQKEKQVSSLTFGDDFPSGLYVVQITSGHTKSVLKVVKK